MSQVGITENAVEVAALAWFEGMGYTVLHGPDIAPDEPGYERLTFADVVLSGRRSFGSTPTFRPRLSTR